MQYTNCSLRDEFCFLTPILLMYAWVMLYRWRVGVHFLVAHTLSRAPGKYTIMSRIIFSSPSTLPQLYSTSRFFFLGGGVSFTRKKIAFLFFVFFGGFGLCFYYVLSSLNCCRRIVKMSVAQTINPGVSFRSMVVKPPSHPTYDMKGVIKLALAEDAGDRGF
jgi:hypothetical protein